MSKKAEKYIVGFNDGCINISDSDVMSLTSAVLDVKSRLEEDDEDGLDYIIYELVPVKKFKMIKTLEIVEVPIKQLKK